MRPSDLFLLEISAGVYEARWTVPADVDAGRYDVVATLMVGGIRLAATPPAALELVRQVEEVTVPPLAPTPPPAEPRLPAAPHVHGYRRLPPPPFSASRSGPRTRARRTCRCGPRRWPTPSPKP